MIIHVYALHHITQDWECRDEDDMMIIERILLLIRNILHIPTEAAEEQVRS